MTPWLERSGILPLRKSFSLVLALLLSVLPVSAVKAQEPELTDVGQYASVVYGDKLTFTLKAESSSTLTEARLFVRSTSSTETYVKSAAFQPDRRIVTAVVALVPELALEPVDTVWFYWEIIDTQGLSYQTPVDQLEYFNSTVPWQWSPATQRDLVIYSNPEDSISGDLIQYAQAVLSNISSLTGFAPPSPTRVYIYPDISTLGSALQAHNKNLQDLATMYVIPSSGTILISNTEETDQDGSLENMLANALVHLVLQSNIARENLPFWYQQGLAWDVIHSDRPAAESLLEQVGQPMTILELCRFNSDSMALQPSEAIFSQSGAFVRFVREAYGVDKIKALGQAFAEGAACDTGISQTLGVSLAQLQGQWHNDLLSTGISTSDRISYVSWVIVWAVSLFIATLFVAPKTARRLFAGR